MRITVRSFHIGLIAAAALCMGSISAAQAQVQMEGKATFQARSYPGGVVQATGHLDGLANYSYTPVYNVSILLVLSKKPYKAGKKVKGYTVASTTGNLQARSRYQNVNMSGETRAKAGKYKMLMLVVDGSNKILDGLTFKGKKAKVPVLPLQLGAKSSDALHGTASIR